MRMDILSLANPCLDHDGMVDNTLHVAHIALGNIDIGIPLEHVRQVLPWPEHLHRLPRRQNEIVGIFSYRNQTIPLVDLHHWLGIESIESNKQHQQIMILGTEGRHIAFAVDELHGLKKFPHYAIQRIYQDTENADEFFHSIIMCNENNRFINLLDPERLLKKAQAWSSGVSKLPNTTRPNIHPSDIPNNTTKNHYKKPLQKALQKKSRLHHVLCRRTFISNTLLTDKRSFNKTRASRSIWNVIQFTRDGALA